MVCVNMARIWHRNKCLILSTAYLASVTILTLSHRALSGSQWEGVEEWTTGSTDCDCQPAAGIVTAKWNASNVPKSLCGPTADLRGKVGNLLNSSHILFIEAITNVSLNCLKSAGFTFPGSFIRKRDLSH